MTVWQAVDEGWRRALRAPAVVAGAWLTTLAVAVPLGFVLYRQISHHLGASVAAQTAIAGINTDWWNEFVAQAGGVGQTFVPAIMAAAAVIQNISHLADAQSPPLVIAIALAVHVMVSIFLVGGILDRLARDRRLGAYGFFAACGAYWFRLLRLAAIAAVVYWALFARLHPLLFDRLYASLTQDVTVERTAFLYRAALYAVFGAILVLVNLIMDYAKIRLVVEDRLSAIGALSASWRFVWRHPTATFGVYLLNALIFVVVLAAYTAVAFVATTGVEALLALLIGQLYIVLRVVVRLTFAGSQIAFFQSQLAHAGYTARPIPAWPESAAAEAVRPD
jgi:hypothetical protein